MEEELIKKVDEKIKNIVKDDINTANLDHLYKLSKIKHLTKEDEQMNYGYGNYSGRGPGHGSYGNYGDNYGRRGVDSRYRGHEYLERMSGEYGRYEEGRSYGANEDTKRSLEYMLRSMEDFARMLKEEAQSQEEVEMIRQTAQRIANM